MNGFCGVAGMPVMGCARAGAPRYDGEVGSEGIGAAGIGGSGGSVGSGGTVTAALAPAAPAPPRARTSASIDIIAMIR